MKTIMIIFVIACWLNPLFADEETLVSGDIESGWFFASVNELTSINNEMTHLDGWQLSWVANSTYNVGWTSIDSDDDLKTSVMLNEEPIYAKMNLHGLHFEYVWNSDKMFHWIAGMHAGFGNFEYNVSSGSGDFDKDWIYFATPSAAIEVNLFTWMRVDVGASYHLITGVDLNGLSASEFGGPNAMVKLKFGNF